MMKQLKKTDLCKYNAKTMNYTNFIKYTQLKLRKLIIEEESYNKYVNKLK
jgi:hypothetical protein